GARGCVYGGLSGGKGSQNGVFRRRIQARILIRFAKRTQGFRSAERGQRAHKGFEKRRGGAQMKQGRIAEKALELAGFFRMKTKVAEKIAEGGELFGAGQGV